MSDTARVCKLCRYWQPEKDLLGSLKVPVFGHCHVGHDPNLTVTGRMTTDLTSCTAWAMIEEKAKDKPT